MDCWRADVDIIINYSEDVDLGMSTSTKQMKFCAQDFEMLSSGQVR